MGRKKSAKEREREETQDMRHETRDEGGVNWERDNRHEKRGETKRTRKKGREEKKERTHIAMSLIIWKPTY